MLVSGSVTPKKTRFLGFSWLFHPAILMNSEALEIFKDLGDIEGVRTPRNSSISSLGLVVNKRKTWQNNGKIMTD